MTDAIEMRMLFLSRFTPNVPQKRVPWLKVPDFLLPRQGFGLTLTLLGRI
jgi:hypothetical protein